MRGGTNCTWSESQDARLQGFEIKREPDSFPKVLVVFPLTHKVLRGLKRHLRTDWIPQETQQGPCSRGDTLMSARSSDSCSSDMDADRSVRRRSSSALFCRASRITTETHESLKDTNPDVLTRSVSLCDAAPFGPDVRHTGAARTFQTHWDDGHYDV